MKSISQLKTIVLKSTDLSEPINYFFDLMENPATLAAGKQFDHKQIEKNDELWLIMQSIEKTLSNFLGKEARASHTLSTFIPEEAFYHGAFFISETPVPIMFFYFSSLKMGMFALSDFTNTDMFRFSLVESGEIKKLH
jgi:hypothetical protein